MSWNSNFFAYSITSIRLLFPRGSFTTFNWSKKCFDLYFEILYIESIEWFDSGFDVSDLFDISLSFSSFPKVKKILLQNFYNQI